MTPILSLWMPIVLSAVFVFVASFVVHMVLTYHRGDYLQLPKEAETMAHLRGMSLAPGMYMFPRASSPKEMGSPAMMEKYKQGPVGMLLVGPSGPPAMPKMMTLWFAYCVVMGVFVAYLAGRTLAVGTPYLLVFRFAGTVAFVGYGLANAVNSIWMMQPWSSTAKHTFDGLLYALLTAGTFGWLWPR